MAFDITKADPLVFEPFARAGGINLEDHFVELYDDDDALVDSVRTFISIGINEGEAGIVIATPEHAAAIEAALERDVDVPAARRRGLLITLDAADTLARLMDGDVIDPLRFEEVVGGLLPRAAEGGRKARVFGEMVAVLWSEGNARAVMKLEDAWNRLARTRPFRLFCAYPTDAFDADDTSAVTAVCNRHSQVVVSRR